MATYDFILLDLIKINWAVSFFMLYDIQLNFLSQFNII